MILRLRQIAGVLALLPALIVLSSTTTAQASCRSICISERHWAQLVKEDASGAHWVPDVGAARCGRNCDGASCTDGAKNHGRCGRVCGSTGEYACFGQKRGWNYSWRLP